MAIKTTIKCDICKVEKAQTNHWFRVSIDGGTFRSGSIKPKQKAWVGQLEVCGAGHAQALYQRFLATGNLEVEMHPEKVQQRGTNDPGTKGD